MKQLNKHTRFIVSWDDTIAQAVDKINALQRRPVPACRFSVIAPPGAGKTTFVSYLSRRPENFQCQDNDIISGLLAGLYYGVSLDTKLDDIGNLRCPEVKHIWDLGKQHQLEMIRKHLPGYNRIEYATAALYYNPDVFIFLMPSHSDYARMLKKRNDREPHAEHRHKIMTKTEFVRWYFDAANALAGDYPCFSLINTFSNENQNAVFEMGLWSLHQTLYLLAVDGVSSSKPIKLLGLT